MCIETSLPRGGTCRGRLAYRKRPLHVARAHRLADEASLSSPDHREEGFRRLVERTRDQASCSVSPPDLADALGHGDTVPGRSRREVAVGESVGDGRPLVVECPEDLDQPVRVRLESRSGVVSHQAGKTLVALLSQPLPTVERVEFVNSKLGRVADVMQVRGRDEYTTIMNVNRARDLASAHGDFA